MTCNRLYCVAFVCCILAQICLVYTQDFNKSSFTFVIDASDLIVNETEQVKSSIDSILETVRMSTASQIQHFVSITFDDPEYTLHVVTKNMDVFRKAASKVYLRGGNPQYAEYVMTGIKVAIENSLPYSTVYVFTDASAKYSEIYEEVKSMAQKKQIQVTFMLTGDCGFGENNRCKVYNQLARATNGEVFNLMKSDITDILEYVKGNTKSRNDIIASKKFPPGYGHKLEFFVQNELAELIISVNGLKPKVEVTDSKGNKVGIKHIVNKDEIAIIKVTHLKLGVYIADVGSTSETHVKIMGNSTDHFYFGFSPFRTSSLSDTATRPALDGYAYSSIKLQGERVKLETVQIIDIFGNILEELPLLLNNDKEGFYVNKSFRPLNVPFQLSVSGFIKKNINQTSLTPIGRQNEKFGSKWFDIEEDNTKKIEKSEQGTCTCLARNKIGNDINLYTVNVNDCPIVPKIESSMLIDPGTSFDVPCDTKHNNTDVIRWYKDSRLIAYGKLTLKNISPRDSGIYSCRVGDMWESSSSHVEIKAGYGPYFYTKETEIIPYEERKIYHLICSASGLPEPEVTWAYNGKTLGITSMINTIEMTLSNRGNYTCEISNSYGSIKRSFLIISPVPPTIEKPKFSTIDLLVDTGLILQCNADGHPEPKVKWIFQEFDTKATPRTIRSNVKTKGFNLPRVQIKDQGNYTCEASNIGGKTNITYTVKVNAAPIIQNLYAVKTFTCVKGDLGLRIQCKATGYPKPSIVWKKDGLDIVSGSKWFDIEEGALIIKNIEKRQQGTYTCLARNKIGNDSSVYTVHVNDYPIIPKIKSPMFIKLGTSFDVPCDIKHKDTDFIRWYKDSRLIAHGKLTFKNISSLDSGIYSCRVGDMWESSSSHVDLKIGYEPYFNTEETEIIPFKEGRIYHLICYAKGLPQPKITWTYNGKTLGLSSMIHTIEMTLSNRGNYTCEVSNSHGSIKRSFRILSEGECLTNTPTRECRLEIKKDILHKNQPMMITPGKKWPTFYIDDGYMVIKKGVPFYLHCPEQFIKFNINYMMAYCDGETQIRINDKIYEYTEIECRQEIKPVINNSTKRCLLGKGVSVEVGYQIIDRFLNVYNVCLDTNKNVPLYTRHVLTPDQYNVSTTKNVWWPTYLLPHNFDTIYNCKSQAHYISSILEKPFHDKDQCCFGKRQLVSPMDFTPGIPETTAHTYLNVVPHWSTCNSKNWEEIEQKVRNLAKLLNKTLTILTGTAEPLQMNGSRGYSKIIIDDDRNKKLPVARYLWKVVQDPTTGCSLAIIQINVPDLSPEDIPLQIRCRDICDEIEWLKGVNWQNISNGYTYCCSIVDFEKAFNFRGEFSRGNTKILNKRSDTPAYTDNASLSDYSDY